jgi:AP-2 complex subunit alpha
VDVILQCISLAGDFVTEDIWYRVVQIVTNNEDLQEYAATNCYKFLDSPNVHENGVKVAAYILGEFGDQIKDPNITGTVLFELLHSKFRLSGNSTKALLLSAYIKMANTYPELKEVPDTPHTATHPHTSYTALHPLPLSPSHSLLSFLSL